MEALVRDKGAASTAAWLRRARAAELTAPETKAAALWQGAEEAGAQERGNCLARLLSHHAICDS
ncbi:hypothetical protein HaLaN_15707, partial [Haematococcus lacustris]